MSLLSGKREGEKEEKEREKKKKSFHAPIHIGVTNIAVHYHFYINQFLPFSFTLISSKSWMFFFNHWYASEKWMIPFEQGLETVNLLIYDLKRICKYSLNTKQPAIMFLYWASIESLCWLFFYPAKQNKFLPEIQLCTGIVVINNRERFVCWRSMLFAQRATISFLQQLAFLPSV